MVGSCLKVGFLIKEYSNEEDFSLEEKIEYIVSLTGIFPFDLLLSDEDVDNLYREQIYPLSYYDEEKEDAIGFWFIIREKIPRKTKNGKDYVILNVIDSIGKNIQIKSWGLNRKNIR